MRRYLVDFLFLPDRDSGVQVEVQAAGPDEAVTLATCKLAGEIGATWAFELDTVGEA